MDKVQNSAGFRPSTFYNDLCRLCSSEDGIIIINIFDEEGRKRQLPTLINSCLPLLISENDRLPKLVCHRCLHKLEMFQEFRENCFKSNERLKSYLSFLQNSELSKVQSSVKQEVIDIESDTEDDQQNFDEDIYSNEGNSTVLQDRKGIDVTISKLEKSAEVHKEEEERVDPMKYLLSLCENKKGIEVVAVSDSKKDATHSLQQPSHSAVLPDKTSLPPDIRIQKLPSDITVQKFRSCNISISRNNSDGATLSTVDDRAEEGHGIALFKCDNCQGAFTKEHDYKEHVVVCRREHVAPKSYTSEMHMEDLLCDSGSSSSHDRKQMDFNLQSPHGSFLDQSSSDSHLSFQLSQNQGNASGVVCTSRKEFECDLCGEKFLYKHTLSTHRRLHTGEKVYQCGMCHKFFSQRSLLVTHERSHTGEKPFKCEVCGKTFSQLGNLNVHKRSHVSGKPFTCEKCGKRFKQKSSLITHHMISHRFADNNQQGSQPPS